ncbi:hypothetical protein B0H16DRAFT_1602001, partial [Mycena metata]
TTGRLTPKELKQLYMARVDCHLIHGCEIAPDSEDTHVKQLCKVQVNFLRYMLNIHSRSAIAPLFTETGIMPIRVRRLLLGLGHLVYFLSLDDSHYARASLNSSMELAAAGKYLTMVKTQEHREAITSVLLSTHRLALEVLRYVDHAHQPVPRAERL